MRNGMMRAIIVVALLAFAAAALTLGWGKEWAGLCFMLVAFMVIA